MFIYDNIEELDQSHADRRAEIANILTQLPQYIAYCKIPGFGGKPHDRRVRTCSPESLPSYEDYKRQTETEEQKRRREATLKKTRGIKLEDIELASSLPDSLRVTMKELEKFSQQLTEEDIITPEARLKRARSRSREQFGMSRSEIEEQIRRRQGPGDEGDSGHPAKKHKGPPPPVSPPPERTIGRRSPKE